MKHLAKYHFWVGVIGLIAFILTGQYMQHAHNELMNMPDAPRLLFRSAHIYLLFAALCNLFYSRADGQQFEQGRWLNWVVSLTLLCAPILMTLEFFYGANSADEDRIFLKIGTYSLFASAVLYIFMCVINHIKLK